MLDSEWPERKRNFERWLDPANFDGEGRQKLSLADLEWCTMPGEPNELTGSARKIALVTAAGQGIGRAIAEAFAAEGATVIATDLAEDKLAGLQGGEAAKARRAGAGRHRRACRRDWRASSAALDILVNCAGYVANGSVLDCTEKDWDFSFDLNVKSMHRMIKTFLPAMLEKKSGSIVNISSAVSSIRGVPNRYAYGATKAAVIGLTKSVAADFITQGIRCNAVCPGTIESPSLDERIAAASQQTGKSPERCGRTSSIASRWDGLARRRKSPRSRSSSPATRQATSPARRISSTAVWRCNLDRLPCAFVIVRESGRSSNHCCLKFALRSNLRAR